MTYVIEPQNEPHGEGNGWDLCAEELAVVWALFDEHEMIDSFYTRAEAEQELARLEEGKR